MEHTLLAVTLGIFGLLFGSFAGATVWRLRARQLEEDKQLGERVEEAEYLRLKSLNQGTYRKEDRSRCLDCGHRLAWYDLVPLVSWLQLGGKCRYCKARIGYFEPLMELGVAAFFVLSFLFWPLPLAGAGVVQFGLWLLSGVGLAILFAYDQKWFLLPDKVMFTLVATAGLFALLTIAQAPNHLSELWSAVGSIGILSGLYLLLWWVSKSRWVGFGDVKLGLVLALLLGDWGLALVALFAANVIGCLVILPGLMSRTLSRTARIPFGPFLILGMLVAFFVGRPIIAWYFGLSIEPFIELFM